MREGPVLDRTLVEVLLVVVLDACEDDRDFIPSRGWIGASRPEAHRTSCPSYNHVTPEIGNPHLTSSSS